MEKEDQLMNILRQVYNRNKHYRLAQKQILNLFSNNKLEFRKDEYGYVFEAKLGESPCDLCMYTFNYYKEICNHCLKNNDVDTEYYYKL